ncbi:hypothetical protein CLIB1423_22S01904 [[Candida] railenensis]|uniref:Uncharacterized protein n=1 Tax=[Candida] railenensis TaxID=45579 RepID=A0A9P0W0M9_9ASCO|nr:hypothetical protein CLIB1423_22S01904 [[Candida] railenensis]
MGTLQYHYIVRCLSSRSSLLMQSSLLYEQCMHQHGKFFQFSASPMVHYHSGCTHKHSKPIFNQITLGVQNRAPSFIYFSSAHEKSCIIYIVEKESHSNAPTISPLWSLFFHFFQAFPHPEATPMASLPSPATPSISGPSFPTTFFLPPSPPNSATTSPNLALARLPSFLKFFFFFFIQFPP